MGLLHTTNWQAGRVQFGFFGSTDVYISSPSFPFVQGSLDYLGVLNPHMYFIIHQ